MIFVYGILTLLAGLAVLRGRSYKKDFFKDLEKKEHPLRFFYGASLKIYEIFRSFVPEKAGSKVNKMIRSLCVKENVKKETTLYYVKKISLCLCLILACCAFGLICCAADRGIEAVTTLKRNEYGEGTASYELNVSYDGTQETMEIEIEERLYTDEEIYALFEEAYEAIKEEVLADNESFDEVSSPLDLVSDHGEIDIYWEIEDTDIISYNGQITAEIEEDESITVNLSATFTLEDLSAVYIYPVTIVSETLSEKELLISYIVEEIEENNNAYESEVSLPEDINGISITFSEIEESSGAVFLILAIAGLFAVIVLYDRRLEEKMKEREAEMMLDFTEIATKLSLLYEAGLSIYRAWERIVSDHEKKKDKKEHFAYQEMKLALEKIKSGVSESAAYEEFGQRCGLHAYIKLGNILSQNLSKGSRGMKSLLSAQAQEAFEQRKRFARKKGEEAGTKLLIPMVLLLITVIIIVAVPALMSISV